MAVVQLYAKTCVRKQFLHSPIKLDQVFFSQTDLLVTDWGKALGQRIGGAEAPPISIPACSHRAQIHRGNTAALALLQIVADPLALPQIIHPGALDGGDVNEHVSARSFGLNKPVTLLRIK